MGALLSFLLAGIAGGLLIAGLTALPVRRLDRALADFRKRGFRGGLKVEGLGTGGEMASAVSAINELGGRLEAMDERAREREALLASLSQSLEEGMLAIDERGVPVAWNAAALRILGLPEGTDEAGLREALERHKELAIGWSAGSALAARVVDIPRSA
jgi:PAS domain-containing protein